MNNETVSSLIASLNIEVANSRKWQSKAAVQADEIKRLHEAVQRLRKDKLQLLADLRSKESKDE